MESSALWGLQTRLPSVAFMWTLFFKYYIYRAFGIIN